jgi:hypothetical protein
MSLEGSRRFGCYPLHRGSIESECQFWRAETIQDFGRNSGDGSPFFIAEFVGRLILDKRTAIEVGMLPGWMVLLEGVKWFFGEFGSRIKAIGCSFEGWEIFRCGCFQARDSANQSLNLFRSAHRLTPRYLPPSESDDELDSFQVWGMATPAMDSRNSQRIGSGIKMICYP